MTLFDIAKRNIKKNTKQYVLYFYPMVFSIIIYYTFVSLQYNQQIIDATVTLGKIEPAFIASSILLFVFAALFIGYSNGFFTRKRKKEIALYSLFGIPKKQIAKLLFYENILLGIVALVVGLLIGTLLSKLFVMIFFKLVGFSVVVKLTISSEAIIQTTIVFFLIIFVTAVHNYRLIYRYSLKDLFEAERTGERQPKGSNIFAVLSLLLIGSSYYILLQPSDSVIWDGHGFRTILIILFSIIVGTFLLLQSFAVFVLKMAKSNQRFYLKGSNLISISHLLFRLKGNILMLTVIALLSSVTLFAVGTSTSLYYNLNKISQDNYPFSLIYSVQDEKKDERIRKLVDENGKITLDKKIEYLQVIGDLSNTNRLPADYPILLLSEATFRGLAKELGIAQNIQFKEHEAIVFYDGNLNMQQDPYTGKNIKLTDDVNVTIASYQNYSLLNQMMFVFPIIIKDSLYEELRKNVQPEQLQLYKIKNDKVAGELFSKVDDVLREGTHDYYEIVYSNFYEEYQTGVETYGLLIFISSFLGFVFLFATGSMLYYKLLAETTTDKSRYDILKKIGMKKKDIQKSIQKQVLFVFLLPLVIAISHSSFLISAVARLGQFDILVPFSSVIGVYIVMYLVYFFITTGQYNRLVNE